MRDWPAFVRSRLTLPRLTPEREARIVRELAAQLEDFYREALGRGLDDHAADAHACAQISDWTRMAREIESAAPGHRRPRLERFADSLDRRPLPGRKGSAMLADALRDARYAVRQLIKTPGFTLTAMLTIALGIGATTAIFSVVNGVLLRPLPYGDPSALVRINEVLPKLGLFSVAPATFLDWRQQNTTMTRLAAYGGTGATFTDNDGAVRIQGENVTWDLFELLGVKPVVGTGFTADQDAPGKNNVIVLSHTLWSKRYGADPHVVGQSITVNGTPMTIVGVMPPDFYFPNRAVEFWRPLALDPANATRGGHFLGTVGRLKPGVTLAAATTEMKTISERLAVQYPDASAGETASVIPLHEQVVGSVRPAILTLFAAVGVVVLIACANVANLLLVRASVREKEIAIRAALGAGRRRLMVQMLVESLVLALTGGLLGTALAYLASGPIHTLGAGSIPRVADVSIDGSVLAFTLIAALGTGLLFGLAPAWQASRVGLGAVLKEGGRSSVGTGGRWLRNALLVVEVALSIILLVGAALLVRSFDRLTTISPGFQADHVLSFQISLPASSYPEKPQRLAFFDRLFDRLSTMPDVRGAGMVQSLPLRGDYVLSFSVQGRPPLKPEDQDSANHRSVSPGYFQALGIPLIRGRWFDAHDTDTAAQVAVIDDAFVRRHFPNEDPIGHRLDIGNGTDKPYEIVGVVGNVRSDSLDATPKPTMYVPYPQDVFSTMAVVVRTTGDPGNLSASVRQVVRELDRTLPAYAMTPLSTVVSDSVAQQRFSVLLLGVFALIALFLAGVGLYGVVAFSVGQRTREIGLRMAMGAQPGDVLRMILGGGMRLALIGVAVGLAGAMLLAQLLKQMLFEVGPLDPLSYVVTATVLLAIAMFASFVPARRAMGVDPLVALQQE